MAGLLDAPNGETDARIDQLRKYLTSRAMLPIGGKAYALKNAHSSTGSPYENMGYVFRPGSEGSSSKAYDATMNAAESELQDLLVRKYGQSVGSAIFSSFLPKSNY